MWPVQLELLETVNKIIEFEATETEDAAGKVASLVDVAENFTVWCLQIYCRKPKRAKGSNHSISLETYLPIEVETPSTVQNDLDNLKGLLEELGDFSDWRKGGNSFKLLGQRSTTVSFDDALKALQEKLKVRLTYFLDKGWGRKETFYILVTKGNEIFSRFNEEYYIVTNCFEAITIFFEEEAVDYVAALLDTWAKDSFKKMKSKNNGQFEECEEGKTVVKMALQ